MAAAVLVEVVLDGVTPPEVVNVRTAETIAKEETSLQVLLYNMKSVCLQALNKAPVVIMLQSCSKNRKLLSGMIAMQKSLSGPTSCPQEIISILDNATERGV
jgi:hypothetical protein